ncbi:hypothetical protein [Lentzea sp. NPDC092896]|uniref:hypothetical protein n=1 Tax=Lentzea sp. NPDC092896 TaxID=3364127 RepID=UPI003814D218
MTDTEVLIDAESLRNELEALRERRDEAMEAMIEDLKGVAGSVTEIDWELDDQLAECQFDLVGQGVSQAIDLVAAAGNGQLVELAELASVDFPGDTRLPIAYSTGTPVRPRLSDSALPTPAIAKVSESDDDDREHALRGHVEDCADRIRYLLDYFSDELWCYLVDSAADGDLKVVQEALSECDAVAQELHAAYELWIMWLNELYKEGSSNIGYAGEFVDASRAWLKEQSGE